MNLVFLFDGSRSMTTAEFEENKHFIKEIMANLSGSSIKVSELLRVFLKLLLNVVTTSALLFFCQFAAVQFSTDVGTVFDFNNYTDGKSHDLLMKEKHMDGLTNTYKALAFVL